VGGWKIWLHAAVPPCTLESRQQVNSATRQHATPWQRASRRAPPDEPLPPVLSTSDMSRLSSPLPLLVLPLLLLLRPLAKAGAAGPAAFTLSTAWLKRFSWISTCGSGSTGRGSSRGNGMSAYDTDLCHNCESQPDGPAGSQPGGQRGVAPLPLPLPLPLQPLPLPLPPLPLLPLLLPPCAPAQRPAA
jgi:hypothetical protein